MTALILISFFTFVIYVLGTSLHFGIPSSVSDTYYLLEKEKKGKGILFTLMCWVVPFALLPALFDMTSSSYQFLAFLAGAGLAFVGAAAQFKQELTKSVHYGGAFTCIASSQIWAFINCWWIPLIAWLVYAIGTIVYMSKHISGSIKDDFLSTKPMFWIEIAAFVAMYATIAFTL